MIILLGVDVWDINSDAKKAYGHFFEWTHGVWSFLDALLSFSSQGYKSEILFPLHDINMLTILHTNLPVEPSSTTPWGILTAQFNLLLN